MDIRLQCRCGALRGIALAVEGSPRIVCYCDDCQAYARRLGAEGVLDEHGGTDIVPVTPARLRITEGARNLRCLRLTAKGMYRWYAGCCRTPIANTMSARMPYAGVVHSVLNRADRDAAVPRVTARVQGRFAIGEPPAGTLRSASPRVILRVLRFLAVAFLTRQGQPSPFFTADGRPRAEPEIIAQP
jgi:hypothetical protein